MRLPRTALVAAGIAAGAAIVWFHVVKSRSSQCAAKEQPAAHSGAEPVPSMSPRALIGLVDLTLLDISATTEQIQALCKKALAAKTAAVCVMPCHVAVARASLPVGCGVKVATTPGGFPVPLDDLSARVKDVRDCVTAGADEIDVVLEPGQSAEVSRAHLTAIRAALPGITLKVILETALRADDDLRAACRLSLECGADFLKTCTGKRGSADARAVRILAEEICAFEAAHPASVLGLKVSGGVRTTADAVALMSAALATYPRLSLTAPRCRIGASALLDALLADCGGSVSAPAAAGSY